MTQHELETFLSHTSRTLPEGSVADETLRYMHSLLSQHNAERTIETGSGRTTVLFAAMSKQHTVVCLENSPHLRRFANTANVNWVYVPTQRTLPAFNFDGGLDFALIDGPHAYPFPELEYFFVYPHLREGAVLAIDDVHIPTIHNMLRFLVREKMFDYLQRVEKTVFFKRNSAPLFHPYEDNWWLQQFNIDNIDRYKPLVIRLKCWVKRMLTGKARSAQ